MAWLFFTAFVLLSKFPTLIIFLLSPRQSFPYPAPSKSQVLSFFCSRFLSLLDAMSYQLSDSPSVLFPILLTFPLTQNKVISSIPFSFSLLIHLPAKCSFPFGFLIAESLHAAFHLPFCPSSTSLFQYLAVSCLLIHVPLLYPLFLMIFLSLSARLSV